MSSPLTLQPPRHPGTRLGSIVSGTGTTWTAAGCVWRSLAGGAIKASAAAWVEDSAEAEWAWAWAWDGVGLAAAVAVSLK